MGFHIASEKTFRIASDLGVCDSNRIAHRGCIARFGPLSSPRRTLSEGFLEASAKVLFEVSAGLCRVLQGSAAGVHRWAIPPVRLALSGRNSGKDSGNALRAFPGIPVESTAGMPQAL